MKLEIIKILFTDELYKAIKNSDPKNKIFIINAYKRVMKILDNTFEDKNIQIADINKLNITDNMKNKLTNIIKNEKTLMKTDHNHIILKNKLHSLLGIGEKKIEVLLKEGLSNINQLKQKKFFNLLNNDTKLMIKYNPLRKIKYEKIKLIENKLIGMSKTKIVIVGSYRRKLPYSKDIDVLISSTNEKVMDEYLIFLNKTMKEVVVYSKGKDKMSLFIRPAKEIYKVDIFRTHPDFFYSHLLYSTGSKDFNIKMRSHAKKMGLLLNQNGIFKKGEKINKPNDNEKSLFKILNIPYVPPIKRF